jgi:LEA14-like dessication related protein
MRMLIPNLRWYAGLLLATTLLSACASTGDLVSAPDVSLRNVQMTKVEFSRQTFLLSFDVTNPNPFPLPISTVSYGVELDSQRFASGRTQGGFTVPASGDGEFAISVELNLLKTAPQLLYIVRDGEKRDIAYELKGQLSVDIPLVKPMDFESSGAIRFLAQRD